MRQEWLQELARGAVLVTATRRLAAHLVAEYDADQARAGRRCWESPRVLPWSAWLAQMWEDTWPSEVLLADAVSGVLWEWVVSQDASALGAPVLDVGATARLAREAHDLLCLYEIPFSPGPLDSLEFQALGRWLRAYRERLAESRWVDAATLLAQFTELAERDRLPDESAVLLAGFDELAPAQARWLRTLAARGRRIREVPFPEIPSRVRRGCYADGPTEVRAAARWVRHLLESGVPPARIGVACVALEAYAPWIERIFREELVPASVLPGRATEALPFDLSYGSALSREPVISSALDLLGIGPGPEGWETWSSLLRSPFWAGGGEALGRAALEAELAGERGASLPCRDVARRARAVGLPETAGALDALVRSSESRTESRLPSGWGREFVAVLRDCGWSTARGLSSREYQARQAFLEVLAGLRALDGVVGRVGRPWAVDRLRQLCAAPFRPEARGERVGVLGHLQAAGLSFDHLWVLGLHAAAWPPEPAPNPFLPYTLLAAHGVREATPESQLATARRVLTRLLGSAAEVFVSYPRTWEGAEVMPSPLVAGVTEEAPVLAEEASVRAILQRPPVALETVADVAPALEASYQIRRGAELLADQAACPFRAFARHRLAAAGLAAPDQALDPLERGVAVHRCLEHFWEEVGDSDRLGALSPGDLTAVIARAVEAGLSALDEGRKALPDRVRELEGGRIETLLREWLEVERGRGSFRVLALEAPRDASVGGLHFRVRVDRVDDLGNGCQVLLDYKTGRPRPTRWFEERPREPQLPLYALACPEARGIGYAVLRRGECAQKEIREVEGVVQGLPRGAGEVGSWEELVATWCDRLGRLAEEVREGRADVAPLEPEVCTFCELPSLCRVMEATRTNTDEGGE